MFSEPLIHSFHFYGQLINTVGQNLHLFIKLKLANGNIYFSFAGCLILFFKVIICSCNLENRVSLRKKRTLIYTYERNYFSNELHHLFSLFNRENKETKETLEKLVKQ